MDLFRWPEHVEFWSVPEELFKYASRSRLSKKPFMIVLRWCLIWQRRWLTISKTILDELGVGYDNNFDAPRLLRETLIRLQLFPSGHESPSDVTESIKKTVNGLMTTVQGLCDLRTREGMASHGREAFSANLEPVQALLAASAADTVAGFLWNVYKSYSPTGRPERISYEDNPEFNDWVDQIHEPPVMIFELPYNHSEILFHLDRQAYSDALQEHLANLDLDEGAEDTPATEEATETTEEREGQS
jgi:hypothetical protein